jgi:hypothetical protein
VRRGSRGLWACGLLCAAAPPPPQIEFWRTFLRTTPGPECAALTLAQRAHCASDGVDAQRPSPPSSTPKCPACGAVSAAGAPPAHCGGEGPRQGPSERRGWGSAPGHGAGLCPCHAPPPLIHTTKPRGSPACSGLPPGRKHGQSGSAPSLSHRARASPPPHPLPALHPLAPAPSPLTWAGGGEGGRAGGRRGEGGGGHLQRARAQRGAAAPPACNPFGACYAEGLRGRGRPSPPFIPYEILWRP